MPGSGAQRTSSAKHIGKRYADMSTKRYSWGLPVLFVLALFGALLLAVQDARAEKAAVFTGIVKGVAVGGYDPVAYFEDAKARPGEQDITLEHDGAIWRFATPENKAAFAADPARYAPQYGGYCAWAVSRGYTAKGDPNAWKVVNGKLYLNYNKDVQSNWAKDIPANIRTADANWPRVLKK